MLVINDGLGYKQSLRWQGLLILWFSFHLSLSIITDFLLYEYYIIRKSWYHYVHFSFNDPRTRQVKIYYKVSHLLLNLSQLYFISQFDSIKIGISFADSFKRASFLDLSCFFLGSTWLRNGLCVILQSWHMATRLVSKPEMARLINWWSCGVH